MSSKFTTADVAAYYNQTQNHYEKWWKLKSGLSLHYGIWDNSTQNFLQALQNTNKILAQIAHIKPNDLILDAGCGVGGAAIFNAQTFGAKVHGITLSEKQVAFAKQKAQDKKLDHLIDFSLQDYTQTNFKNETFDVVWACESVSSAISKKQFISEAYRVVKPGGKLIIADCFKTPNYPDKNNYLKKWSETWGVSNLLTINEFCTELQNIGFSDIQTFDYTTQIKKTVNRLYLAYWCGLLPSKLYNILFKVTRFAKTHYLLGKYQYKAYREGGWNYYIIYAQKPR